MGTTEGASEASGGVLVRLDRYRLIWTLIILFTLFTRFHHLGQKPFHHDESLYGKYIWNYHTGLGYKYDPMQHGPFMFHVAQVSAFLFGISDTAVRLTPAIFGVASVLLLLLWIPLLGRWEACAAAGLMALSPSFTYFHRFLRHDVFFSFNSLAVVTAVAYYLFRGRRARHLLLASLFFAFLFCTKENHFVFAFTMASFFALYLLRLAYRSWLTEGSLRRVAELWGGIFRRYPGVTKGFLLFAFWFVCFALYAVGEITLGKRVEVGTWLNLIRAYWVLVFLGMGAIVGYALWRRSSALAEDRDPGFYADAVWFAWAVGLFAAVYVLLYTGLFSNPGGFWGGVYGWFKYWLNQHEIQRIEGPYHYYHRLLWNYEPLAVAPFLAYVLAIALVRTRGFYAFTVLLLMYGFALLPGARSLLATGPGKTIAGLATLLGGALTLWGVYQARGTAQAAARVEENGENQQPAQEEGAPDLLPLSQVTGAGLLLLGVGLAALLIGDAFHLANKNFTEWNAVYALGCLVVGSSATLWLIRRGRGAHAFLVHWGLLSYLIYSYLQEKVPWLEIHIALPMLLLSGSLIAVFLPPLASRRGWTRRRGAIAVLLALTALYTFHSTFLLNWYNESDPTEQLVYVQTTKDVTLTVAEIEEIAAATGQGYELPILLEGDATWPLYWYLRDYKRLLFGASPGADRPAVAVGNWNDRHALAEKLGEDYLLRHRRLRHWWIPTRQHLFGDTMIQLDLLGAKLTGRADKVTGTFSLAALWKALNTETRYLIRWLLYREKFRADTIYGSTDFAFFVRADLARRGFSEELGPKPPPVRRVEGGEVRERKSFLPQKVIARPGDGVAELLDPKDIAVAPDGSLYVADTAHSRVQKYDVSGNHLLTIGLPGKGPGQFDKPCGVGIDNEGNLLVADTWNHRIQKLSPEGEVLGVWGGPGTFYAPKDVAVFPDGAIVVTDTGFHRVHILNPNGTIRSTFGERGSAPGQFFEPVGLWIEDAESFWVADTANQRLQLLNRQGRVLKTISIPGWEEFYTEPYVARDRRGRLIVSDSFNDRLLVLGPDGGLRWIWGESGSQAGRFKHPVGTTADSAGRLYVVDSGNGRVQVFDLPE